jgi:hypothetical protein
VETRRILSIHPLRRTLPPCGIVAPPPSILSLLHGKSRIWIMSADGPSNRKHRICRYKDKFHFCLNSAANQGAQRPGISFEVWGHESSFQNSG